MTSTALRTDHYELTMLAGALRSGVAGRRAVFEVFTRRLPPGRRTGVVGGIARVADALARFHFGEAELAWLGAQRVVDDPTLEWLAGYRFGGDIHAYAEGELHAAGSPVLTVEATFAEGVVLETLVLSILNHDSAVAAAAAVLVAAAGGRPLIEMGSRRTDPSAAVAAARAAYICGFASTSNLEAGRRHGIPTTGTAAHAFVLAHPDERSAFEAQVAALGADTTLLVDTYDVETGIRTAVDVAGKGLGAVRIDSGDLAREAGRARALLDELGNSATKVVVTGDLDDASVAALAAAPVDAFGVGTSVVTGLGHPAAGFVYKLVAIADDDGTLRPVAKRSPGKETVGGRKWAWRVHVDRPGGLVLADWVATSDEAPPGGRPLQVPVVRAGDPLALPGVEHLRAAHAEARAELGDATLVAVPAR